MDFEKLSELVLSGDKLSCANLVRSLDLKQRRGLVKKTKKLLKNLEDNSWELTLSGYSTTHKKRQGIESQVESAKVAFLGLASMSDIIKLGWKLRPDSLEFAEFVIKSYQYDKNWVDEWIDKLFEIDQLRFLIPYELHQKGYCNRPSHDNYFISLIWAFTHTRHSSLKEELLKRPDLFELEIWKLFELEGTSDNNLAGSETYSNTGWSNTLLELAEEGYLSRDRLLTSSLDALDKDFMQKRSGWFSRFHEMLNPTLEERVEFQSRYLSLLGSQNPPTVSFALKALTLINKNKKLNNTMLIEQIQPVLYAKAKGTVINAMKLLHAVAKADNTLQLDVSSLATHALCHEVADVQKKAFDLLDEFGDKNDENLKERIRINSDMIAASQRTRLQDWVEIEHSENNDEYVVDSSYDPKAKATTIKSLDELISKMGVFLETPEQPGDLESILEAAVRIKPNRDEEFVAKTQALAKRATNIANRSEYELLDYSVSLFVLSFIKGLNCINETEKLAFKEDSVYSFSEVLLEHIRHAASLLTDSGNTQLLASPTHGRGFIDPNILVSRYLSNTKAGVQMPDLEKALSILRIDKSIKLTLDFDYDQSRDEFVNAVLYALGYELKVGKNCSLWIAASRIRRPETKDEALAKRFKYRAPDAFEPPKYRIQFEKETNEEHNYTWCWLVIDALPELPKPPNINNIPTLFHQYLGRYSWDSPVFGHDDLVTRWASTIWPSNLTPYFGYAIHVFSPDENSNWNWKCFFEPMLKSDVPMDEIATTLLFIGLAGSQNCQKSMAMEAAIQAIGEERLDIEIASKVMAKLLTSDYILVNRWTKLFSEIARVSKMHSEFIREVIAKSLKHDPAESPRNLGNLIELLYELQLAANELVSEECAINFFSSNKKGGKQGKFSKKLLSLT